MFCSLALLAFMLLGQSAVAATLTLDLGHGVQQLQTKALLARPDARTIHIPNDVAYHRAMDYRAVPLKALLHGITATDHLQIVALDGFAAEMDAAIILANPGAQAWLAVQNPASPWPSLANGKPGAGPFYIVWTNPQAGHINPEQWPYQIATIRRIGAVAARFPALLPAATLSADAPARRGFAVFRTHCMACHTLNGEGDARLGPDLNIPYNPTEYLKPKFLRAYIRNPQSLRHWPQAKMQGFDRNALSDSDLDDLIAYLHERAKHKQPHHASH
ncbi:MAG: cytochrome c [Xanthomonadales bacterium]|nr:cytochrome c [Xanthomonadales bacterium]